LIWLGAQGPAAAGDDEGAALGAAAMEAAALGAAALGAAAMEAAAVGAGGATVAALLHPAATIEKLTSATMIVSHRGEYLIPFSKSKRVRSI
jgi:hypothetical protein